MHTNRPAGPGDRHLSWDEIANFFLRTEQPEERFHLYHLLAQCEACRQTAHPILELYEDGIIDGSSSWLEIEMAASEWRAPTLWDELVADFPENAGSVVDIAVLRGDDRWPTWGLCVWLTCRSLRATDDEIDEALHWARVAGLGALELPPDLPLPAPWVEELRAFTQVALGDARRRAGKLHAADDAFQQARRHLAAGQDDGDFLPFRPVMLDREAALLRELDRPEDALRRLDQALEAWEVVYGRQLVSRVELLRHKARLLRQMHHLDEALDLHEEAADLLDREVA